MSSEAQKGQIAILGSTGSVGVQSLDIVRHNPDMFRVVSLAAHSNIDLLERQINEFRPQFVAIADRDKASELRDRVKLDLEIAGGPEAILSAATHSAVHTVVGAINGFAALQPILSAVRAKKHIALANKESLVVAGQLVMNLAKEHQVAIVPLDSEHNSLFQCLQAVDDSSEISRIILTASGGPFRTTPIEQLSTVTPKQAIAHPRWSMGAKISVDSATLMNKGLEVIEASVLFNVGAEKIDVAIHPQSIVHGIVELCDGALLAALSPTDMRIPISYALGYLYSDDPLKQPGPRIAKNGTTKLTFQDFSNMTFDSPDNSRYPSLQLCYRALREGGTMPVVLNAANEVVVGAFLEERVGFEQIYQVVEKTLDKYSPQPGDTVEDIVKIDSWARETASNLGNLS